MILFSGDPGTRGCGGSLFKDNRLFACAYIKNPAKQGNGPSECREMAQAVRAWVATHFYGTEVVERVMLEFPQIYMVGGGRTKGQDNNDLLPLACVDGAIAALFPHAKVDMVKPSEWKGGLKKITSDGVNPIDLRVRARLDPEEMKIYEAGIVEAKSLAHNLVDSVGIGLKGLQRFEPVRVIHR